MENIFEIIVILFLNSFWIFGTRTLFSHGHILEEVDRFLEANLSEYVYKPTIGCVMCMASVHRTMAFFILLWPQNDIMLWPIYCICLCGLNSIIDHAIS
jgi:hypothetical protein